MEVYKLKNVIVKGKNGARVYSTGDWLAGKRIISLFGTIDEENVNSLIQQILCLNMESQEEITLLINSSGGNINQGLALCDAIELSTAPIRTIAIGTVASMATVIFASGAIGRREIYPSARIMMHDPRVVGNSGVITVNDALELGKNLKETKELINKRISSRTGKTLEKVNEDSSYDHYFNAEEAIEYGLGDRIIESLTGEKKVWNIDI